MSRTFAKRAQAPPSEEIPEDLLASIPDIQSFPPEPATSEARAALKAMRAQMERSFARELDGIEDAFASLVAGLEARLARTREELDEAHALNASYAKRFEALKALTQDIDE